MFMITVKRLYSVIGTAFGVGIERLLHFAHHSVDSFFVSVALHHLQTGCFFLNIAGSREYLRANKMCKVPLI